MRKVKVYHEDENNENKCCCFGMTLNESSFKAIILRIYINLTYRYYFIQTYKLTTPSTFETSNSQHTSVVIIIIIVYTIIIHIRNYKVLPLTDEYRFSFQRPKNRTDVCMEILARLAESYKFIDASIRSLFDAHALVRF